MCRAAGATTAANAAGLTLRQLDVLLLLTEGIPNAEVTQRLSLWAKTVDHDISAVLGEFGVTNRGEAAAAAHRLYQDDQAAALHLTTSRRLGDCPRSVDS